MRKKVFCFVTNSVHFRMIVTCTCFSQTCIITAIRREPLTGAFRMPQELTCRIVKFWSSRDLSGRLGAIFWHQRFLWFHNHKPFNLSYTSLLQSQDLLHHDMACIIYLNLSIYIHTANLAADGFSSVIRGAPGDARWENLEMHWEAVIVWT